MVCNVHQNLKALLKHHGSQKVIGRCCVRRDHKERHLLFTAQLPQVDCIVLTDRGNGWNVECTHTQSQRDIDALCGLAGCHFVELVLLGRKGFRFSDTQILKNQIQLADTVGAAVSGIQHHKQRHNAVHVALLRFFLIKHISDERFQQGCHAFLPDGVGGSFRSRVFLQIFHKVFGNDQNVILVSYIGEQIVVVGFLTVFQVKDLDLVPLREQHIPIGIEQFALRITENIVAVELQKLGTCHAVAFAGT